MSTDPEQNQKSSGTSQNDEHTGQEDTHPDLSKFQVRILAILATDDHYGLAIRDKLSDYYGEEINHGRLYPNLDTLADKGLVEKSDLDRRTNNYSLTDRGVQAINAEYNWLEARLNGGGDA